MVKFFTLHFALFTLRSFAFAGLFLVGNNVFADPAVIMPPDDQSGGGGIIVCTQNMRHGALCWKNQYTWFGYWKGCEFSGMMSDVCTIPGAL